MSANKALLPAVLIAAAALALGGAALLNPTAGGPAAPPTAAEQPPAAKAEPDARDADRAAIRAATASFVKALAAGDAKALAAHWTAEGEYVGGDGATYRGRAALEKAYKAAFAKRKGDFQTEFESDSLRFLSKDTAVEEGHFRVRGGGKADAPAVSRASILFVREDGKWLLATVREWPAAGDSLRDIDWLVGTWEAKRDGVTVRTTYEWALGKAYLQGRFEINEDDETTAGLQMIGPDPTTGRLRMWTFDSEGGHGDATWTRDGAKWLVETAAVLPDGTPTTATNIFTRVDADTFTWQSVHRTSGDNPLPDVPPIKVTRVKGKP